jgi:hypothetical protein
LLALLIPLPAVDYIARQAVDPVQGLPRFQVLQLLVMDVVSDGHPATAETGLQPELNRKCSIRMQKLPEGRNRISGSSL